MKLMMKMTHKWLLAALLIMGGSSASYAASSLSFQSFQNVADDQIKVINRLNADYANTTTNPCYGKSYCQIGVGVALFSSVIQIPAIVWSSDQHLALTTAPTLGELWRLLNADGRQLLTREFDVSLSDSIISCVGWTTDSGDPQFLQQLPDILCGFPVPVPTSCAFTGVVNINHGTINLPTGSPSQRQIANATFSCQGNVSARIYAIGSSGDHSAINLSSDGRLVSTITFDNGQREVTKTVSTGASNTVTVESNVVNHGSTHSGEFNGSGVLVIVLD